MNKIKLTKEEKIKSIAERISMSIPYPTGSMVPHPYMGKVPDISNTFVVSPLKLAELIYELTL